MKNTPLELQEVVDKVLKARRIWFMNNRPPKEPEIYIYVQEDIWRKILQQAVGCVSPPLFEAYENKTILGHPVHVVRVPDYRSADHGIKVFAGGGV